MTRSQSRSSRNRASQIVNVIEPDISSAASLVLLVKKYCSMDKDIYAEGRMSRLRRKWINNLMKTPDEKGGLTCAICGRKGLLSKVPQRNNRENLATLDHIIRIIDGGKWNDPNNFQVACYKCNIDSNNRKEKQIKTMEIYEEN